MTDYLFSRLPPSSPTVDMGECQDSCCSQVLVTHGDENDFSLNCCHLGGTCEGSVERIFYFILFFLSCGILTNLFKKRYQHGSHTVVNVL